MRRLIVAMGVAVLLALTGCSDTDGDGDADADPVAAAEQRLARARPLDDASTALEEASTAFCDEGRRVRRGGRPVRRPADRRGGDRRRGHDAGSDLQAPREEARAGWTRCTRLATRSRRPRRRSPTPDRPRRGADRDDGAPMRGTTTTTEPPVSEGTVDRVEQAEDDLDAAFQAIDRRRPCPRRPRR